MERLRNASRWIAAAWLVSQLVAVVASTAVLGAADTRVVAVVEHCECAGTAGICPMHPKPAASRDDGQCAMRNCSVPDATLLATAAMAGVMPQVAVAHDDAPPVAFVATTVRPFDRPDRPDAHPPRA